jgi:superkiller protein 3
MSRIVRLLPLLALLLASPAHAQRGCPKMDLSVKVLTNTSRPIHLHAQVDLLTSSGMFVRQAFTDTNGNAQFSGVDSGSNYRLRVTDPKVEENSSDIFQLPCGDTPSFQLVTVKLKTEAETELKREESRQATISALELNVPRGAKKEFQKGAEALAKQDLARAEKNFLRAIELYPEYALAYNHLGVVYMMQKRAPEGVAAFERAVALNDRYPSALVNLAKVRIEQKKIADATRLLQNAVTADPKNAEALTLLAHAQFAAGDYAAAADTAIRVHPLGDEQYRVAHWVAAQAYERQQKDAEAISEYTILLKEVPSGPLAEKARAAVRKLRDANYPAESPHPEK